MSGSKFIRKYRVWIGVGAVAIVGAGAVLAIRSGSAAEPAVTYETEQASVGTISVTVAGTGDLEVDGTTEVYPQIAGTVDEVLVAEGSAVTTGDVLFTLDETSAKADTAKGLASLRQAQQSVAQSQLQVTKAQNALAALQARSAEPSSTVTSADIAAAEGDVTVAKAQLASAQASSATAQLSYQDALDAEDELSVTAPCSGVVYSLDVAAGDAVSTSSGGSGGTGTTGGSQTPTDSSSSSSSAPVTLAPAQPLAVHLTVNEVDLPSLAIGQRADIEFDAFPDLTATGKVYAIGSEGTNSSGVVTFDVWVSLDVADPALRSGMSAAATIVTDVAKNTLLVSNSAVQTDDNGGYYVLVMPSGSSTPKQVSVEVGLASATQTQILSGITEGTTVVTQTVDSSDTSSSSSSSNRSIGFGVGGGPMMGGGPRD